jgi:hypothetical protein
MHAHHHHVTNQAIASMPSTPRPTMHAVYKSAFECAVNIWSNLICCCCRRIFLQACLTLQSIQQDMEQQAAAQGSEAGAAALTPAQQAVISAARRSEALQRFTAGWLRLQNEVNALIDSTTAENTDQAVCTGLLCWRMPQALSCSLLLLVCCLFKCDVYDLPLSPACCDCCLALLYRCCDCPAVPSRCWCCWCGLWPLHSHSTHASFEALTATGKGVCCCWFRLLSDAVLTAARALC